MQREDISKGFRRFMFDLQTCRLIPTSHMREMTTAPIISATLASVKNETRLKKPVRPGTSQPRIDSSPSTSQVWNGLSRILAVSKARATPSATMIASHAKPRGVVRGRDSVFAEINVVIA